MDKFATQFWEDAVGDQTFAQALDKYYVHSDVCDNINGVVPDGGHVQHAIEWLCLNEL